ncbi:MULTISPECIES: hypothetical protein [Nocardia]|uniref:hypothetical protein n=1 Tax=Nocardia TaxID=1817 RepID=UPI000D69CFC8|nr:MULTISPECIES: hypothetical protein [Nocardia]
MSADSPAVKVSLTAFMAAIQAVADAVTTDDHEAYLRASADARSVGVSDEQIHDAYLYRRDLRRDRWPSFDRHGNLY